MWGLIRSVAEGTAGWARQCLVCQRWPSAALCEACVRDTLRPRLRCQRCALPLAAGVALHHERIPAHCAACIQAPPPLDATWAATDYAQPWSALVQRFKYQGDTGLAPVLATLWQQPAIEASLLEHAARGAVLLPIPLSTSRLALRGFNQSHLLAQALRKRPGWGRTAQDALIRAEPDGLSAGPQVEGPQVSQTRSARFKRMKNAFLVHPSHRAAFAKRDVLLVDDVMTTGATLFAAAHCLKTAGAKSVSALVLLRTPEPGD